MKTFILELPKSRRSKYLRRWFVAGCFAVLLTACGSDDANDGATASETTALETTASDTTASETPTPSADTGAAELELPITLSGRTLALVNLERVEGGQIVDIAGNLLTQNGTFADAAFTLIDLRVEGATTICDGETVVGPYTVDTDVKGSGTIDIDGWGKVEVVFDHTWTVFPTDVSPPTCDEQVGTWTGIDGAAAGRTGAIHRLRVGPEETVTLS